MLPPGDHWKPSPPGDGLPDFAECRGGEEMETLITQGFMELVRKF